MDKDELKAFVTDWLIANFNDGDLDLRGTKLCNYDLAELRDDIHEMLDDFEGDICA